ncbi:MAG: helix-turn-helix domain-containing protein [Sphingomonas phyllosphaerae]|uniref:LexA family protein n=1 Tax=Sphingomonas phyllosphaerae TaxID=257003 RepID=UPI002FF9F56B
MTDPDLQQSLAEMPFGLRVRTLRVMANMTQEELAEKADTTKATISKIERSTTKVSYDWARRLAAPLNCSVALLLMGEDLPDNNPVMVPVIGLIAAGNWREAIQQPLDRIAVVGAKPHMFALRIIGDSMDLLAPEGANVTIDPTDPSLTDGSLYAVQNGDGEATIKRFRRSPDRLEPVSSNPVHQPILLGAEPITVIGRATSVTWSL